MFKYFLAINHCIVVQKNYAIKINFSEQRKILVKFPGNHQ